MTSPPARIDRYPGKMVSHLARTLVTRYASDASHLVDPFCGSGAVLYAARKESLKVSGMDINPFGVLLSQVKIEGFDADEARRLCDDLVCRAHSSKELPLAWSNARYWFTPATLRKFQQIRFVASEMGLNDTAAGRGVLLSMGLSVRPCSRSDQRSPKPFISQEARRVRKGKHFDPMIVLQSVLSELSRFYGDPQDVGPSVHHISVIDAARSHRDSFTCSHVITSPPYVNAQDYFRNAKLELYMLEGLLPFRVDCIIREFIGTERGVSTSLVYDEQSKHRRELVPQLRELEIQCMKRAAIVHRYFRDMEMAFLSFKDLLAPDGTLILVCGDNLVGGRRILTWDALNQILESMNFRLFDRFEDRIQSRTLAPKRKGHRGLIKQEVVSAFRLKNGK